MIGIGVIEQADLERERRDAEFAVRPVVGRARRVVEQLIRLSGHVTVVARELAGDAHEAVVVRRLRVRPTPRIEHEVAV